MRPMFRNRRTVSGALALLLALRTFVPAGYMLALPSSEDPFGFSIILCPTQNPTLDLSRLDNGGQQVDHHHNSHDAPSQTAHHDSDDAISFGTGCGIWLNSVSVAFESPPDHPVITVRPKRFTLAGDTRFIRPPPRGHSLSRAPPTLG